MSAQPLQLAKHVSCLSWNLACTELALSPYSNEVHIYTVPTTPGARWNCSHTLTDHHQTVSGLEWAPQTDRIATCSHDRNAFVYVRTATGWAPQVVRARIGQAAMCLQWSPSESKLAIGGSDKAVHVCHYSAECGWWVGRAIRKHDSAVVCVAWHPAGQLLATASTDRRCRVFNAAVREVDGPVAATGFGQLLWQVEPDGSWVHGVCWRPSGQALACCTHNSNLFVWEGPEDAASEQGPQLQQWRQQAVRVEGLPLKVLLFLDQGCILGGGWGGEVQVLVKADGGDWEARGPASACTADEFLGGGQAVEQPGRVAGAHQELSAQRSGGRGPSSPYARSKGPFSGGSIQHSKCVTSLALLPMQPSASSGGRLGCGQGLPSSHLICSAGLDGRVLLWTL